MRYYDFSSFRENSKKPRNEKERVTIYLEDNTPEMGNDGDELSLLCSACGNTVPCRCMFVNK